MSDRAVWKLFPVMRAEPLLRPVLIALHLDHDEALAQATRLNVEAKGTQTIFYAEVAPVQVAAPDKLTEIRAVHKKDTLLFCGAQAWVLHRHSYEPPTALLAKRLMTCTLTANHEGRPHRDQGCCWTRTDFTEGIVDMKPETWRDRSSCSHCKTDWPCPTIKIIGEKP